MNTDRELIEKVLEKLSRELPPYPVYHSPEHTRFVMDRTRFLAEVTSLKKSEKRIAYLGALFHDTRFLEGREDHEEKSCAIAKEELADHGMGSAEIDEVCRAIMATKIPQCPVNPSGEVLADADLFYLGTDRFEEISGLLYDELKHSNPRLTKANWPQIQRDFLKSHRYNTPYGQEVLEPVKQENLRNL